MKHVFVMDPIASIRVDLDSTFALMTETQRRGHEMLYALVDDLFIREGVPYAVVRPVTVQPVQGEHATLGEPRVQSLRDVDVVWMRKDPPFHMGYIFNTYILDLALPHALVVNHPAGLRDMNEKAWAMQFVDLVPPSLITQDMARLRAFIEELGVAIVKPLDGNGGEGVFVVRADDPNIGVILEQSTRHGAIKILAQQYIPEAKQGDKRIILVDGEPVGGILRVPQGVDHRGNIHVGAHVVKCELSERDLEICARIGPYLAQRDQIFVGIDVIGTYLTEVNVTSPTGIHELNAYDGICVEAMVLDAVEKRLS